MSARVAGGVVTERSSDEAKGEEVSAE